VSPEFVSVTYRNGTVVSDKPAGSGAYDSGCLHGFVRTTSWRGWSEGFIVAHPDLSRWWWVGQRPRRSNSNEVIIDLRSLSRMSPRAVCLLLARKLGLSCLAIAAAMGGLGDVYGRQQSAVMRLLGNAANWMTVSVDRSAAEHAVMSHVRSAAPADLAGRPVLSQMIWEYPDATDLGLRSAEAWLAAAYFRLLDHVRSAVQQSEGRDRASQRLLAGAAAAHDARYFARAAVGGKAGTAWPWQRSIMLFTFDAEWTALAGPQEADNPFAPLRALYAMGLSFCLSLSNAYLLSVRPVRV